MGNMITELKRINVQKDLENSNLLKELEKEKSKVGISPAETNYTDLLENEL